MFSFIFFIIKVAMIIESIHVMVVMVRELRFFGLFFFFPPIAWYFAMTKREEFFEKDPFIIPWFIIGILYALSAQSQYYGMYTNVR